MNENGCEAVEDLIQAICQGRLDDLTPQEAQDAAAHLDRCPQCAALIEDVVPDPGELRDADRSLLTPGEPDARWNAISKAVFEPAKAADAVSRRRRIGYWSSFSAAAVLVVSVTLWQFLPQQQALWALDLAEPGEVEIESVEVYGDAHLVLMNLGSDDDTSIIWVTDEEG